MNHVTEQSLQVLRRRIGVVTDNYRANVLYMSVPRRLAGENTKA